MDNNKRVYLIIGVITITMLVMGVTTAWFTWNSTDNTDVTFNVNGIDIINTNVDIVGKELYPTNNKENGVVEEFTVKQNSEISTPVCSDFTLTLTTLPTELLHKSFKYKLYNGTNLVGSGNFEGKTQGQVITIATSQPVTSEISTYKLYIWIDGENYNNPLSMGGKSFLFKLTIKASQQENACTPSVLLDDSGANTPVLAEGMIPIKWDGSKWVKASTTQTGDWYDYDVKKWANAVMVSSDTRDSYMSDVTKPIGSKVLEDDILAYYVWIPRYSYQLFNVNSEIMDPIEIQVMFESKDSTKSTGSTNGAWLTHPAFTFGTDELSGIWVGKFETSMDTSDVCYTSSSEANCDKELDSPRIKPARVSLTYQKVSNQFLTSKKFGTVNYLTSDGVSQVDAHMMKNTEWGAVAYLKQSKYGLGTTDIGNNAYYASSNPRFMAGCGPLSETDLTGYGATCTSYTSSVGIKASTTGNVYGIYDMAGGANEYVMGVLKTQDGTGLAYSSSGFATSTLPLGSKYVDAYTFGTSSRDYTRRILGDATGETRGWYSDYAVFPNYYLSFFKRGGDSYSDSDAGVFDFYNNYGYAYDRDSFRSTLATQ